MTNHLLKRGSRYYIRRKIPIDLRAHYQGRKEIVKALGTSDPADARRLVREESVWLDREFDRLRADPSQNASATDDKPAVYDALSGKSYRPRVTTLTRAQADEMVQDMHESAELFEEPLDAQYANHDRQVARETERQAKHERQVSAYEEALCRIVARHGSLPTTPSSAIRADLRAAEQNRREGGPSVGHLAALAEQWAKERKPTVRTVRKAELIVERFYTLVGRVPVASITRTHVLTFKNKLLESGQTAVNTNKQLTILGTLLNFAADNEQAARDLVRGVKVVERKNAKAARLPFDLTALQAIFSSPVFTRAERPERGAGEAAYWLPLLALFTGARIEELAQMRPEDVYEETYHDADGAECAAWVMRITNEAENQEVKTQASVRRFPIHAELIRLGFIEYAKAQRGNARLFDKLKKNQYGDESALFGAWFSEYLRKVCGVIDKRMVFHSFRHGFKDLCRAAGLPEEIHDALTGHSSSKVARRYGGLTYPLAPLVTAVAKLRVPGLQLPF